MKRWLPVVGVVAVLVIAWFASMYSSTDVTQLPLPSRVPPTLRPEGDGSRRPGPVIPFAGGGFPIWILYLLGGLMLLFVAVVLIALSWTFIRSIAPAKKARLLVRAGKGSPLQERREDGEEVIAALDAGLTELSDLDGNPRRAVIACWVRLERAAAAAGTPRQPGDSPTDLVTRLLSAHRVSRSVLDRFARVYREARYATVPIGEDDRQIAVAALSQMRAELTQPVQPDHPDRVAADG